MATSSASSAELAKIQDKVSSIAAIENEQLLMELLGGPVSAYFNIDHFDKK
eukprot:CAMPEP_0116881306 /NCGR_PEP_ID=MMETSP0463-20121206/13437_1 /TAXON_ID=181622 /ORGANISM="Strombidinopsis sp, Strain SopsisLIS2011" /LENGTH=50 /DNA_ID=CAMNT_0004533157 /DNA_START=40 /DNA_END=192 /DNA_ORIENTATION=-